MVIKLKKIRDEKKKGKLSFLISGSNHVFANAVRRLITEEVPTLAVEDVELKDNDSALYDEMLALRLGLIPIKTDLKSYNLPKNEAEIEERSARCTLQLKLKVSKKGYVYAEDAQSSDPKCVFVYPKMPIVKLLAKQKVDVTMYAVMGQGKDHIKWSPGWAYYKEEPVILLGNVKNPALIVENCTDGVFVMKGNKLTVVEDKVYDSNLLEYYSELDEGIQIDYTDNIIFTMESWGQLTNREILTKSADILLAKVDELNKQI